MFKGTNKIDQEERGKKEGTPVKLGKHKATPLMVGCTFLSQVLDADLWLYLSKSHNSATEQIGSVKYNKKEKALITMGFFYFIGRIINQWEDKEKNKE